MGDDASDDAGEGTTPADSREREHQRRNQLQAELLKRAYDRSRHAAFIEAALRRARGDQDADGTNRHADGY